MDVGKLLRKRGSDLIQEFQLRSEQPMRDTMKYRSGDLLSGGPTLVLPHSTAAHLIYNLFLKLPERIVLLIVGLTL